MSGLRRVVTGHDAHDKAVAIIDGEIANVKNGKSGATLRHIWNTDETPADIAIGESIEDVGLRPHITPPPLGGTRFVMIDYPPGNAGAMHRTETVDYVIVLSGEIDMQMDDSTVHLKAGDVMVQRGTNHGWFNRGTEVARVAFVLVDAQPLGIGHPRTNE